MTVAQLREKRLVNWWRYVRQLTPLLCITWHFHKLVAAVRRQPQPVELRANAEYQLAKAFAKAVLEKMQMRVVVEGAENINGLSQFAIAANHASYLDFAVLLGFFPTPMRFIAKRELRYMPAVGRHLADCGVLIDRKDRRSALTAIEKAVQDGTPTPILIFPEGTRSDDGQPQRFKRGGLTVLAKAHVPIVPVTILNTFQHLPKGAINYQPGGVLGLVIGKPIYRRDFIDDNACIDAIEAVIHQTFAQRI